MEKRILELTGTKIFRTGGLEIPYFPEPQYISKAFILELEDYINNTWYPAIMKSPCENIEQGWEGLNFGVPSPVIGVGMSMEGDASIEKRIISIQKNPPLLRMLSMIAPQHTEHREMVRRGLSQYPFYGFLDIGGVFTEDDRLFAEEILCLPYYTQIPEDTEDENTRKGIGKCYWVRINTSAEYDSKFLKKLDGISLVPVSADGCNLELITLGLAHRLSDILPWHTLLHRQAVIDKNLPWDTSFVVKPIQGLGGENVLIYCLDDSEEERNASKERIIRLMETVSPRKLMIQPYIPDRVVVRDCEMYHEIVKIYLVYLPETNKYAFTGAMVQGSRSRNVCGVDGTYFIPVFSE